MNSIDIAGKTFSGKFTKKIAFFFRIEKFENFLIDKISHIEKIFRL